jgi:hypothetical protein
VKRREFVTLLGGVAVGWPVAARAQAARTRPLIGILGGASRTTAKPQLDAFFDGLRSLGYVEGRDFDVQDRWTDGRNERLPQLAQEIVGLGPDVQIRRRPLWLSGLYQRLFPSFASCWQTKSGWDWPRAMLVPEAM